MRAALLYYRGRGFSAAFIRWFTKSKFAHVAPAMICDNGTADIYDAFWSTGVTERYDLFDRADDVQILPFTNSVILQKERWLMAQVGKRYDKPSILIIGLTKRLPGWLHVYVSRQGEWICSRLAAEFADLALDCWGLNGPPSPEDVHRMITQHQKK